MSMNTLRASCNGCTPLRRPPGRVCPCSRRFSRSERSFSTGCIWRTVWGPAPWSLRSGRRIPLEPIPAGYGPPPAADATCRIPMACLKSGSAPLRTRAVPVGSTGRIPHSICSSRWAPTVGAFWMPCPTRWSFRSPWSPFPMHPPLLRSQPPRPPTRRHRTVLPPPQSTTGGDGHDPVRPSR